MLMIFAAREEGDEAVASEYREPITSRTCLSALVKGYSNAWGLALEQ